MARGDFDEDELDELEDFDDEDDDFYGEPEVEPRWLGADGLMRLTAGEMTCRVCGCSDTRSCPGGCLWAAPNLCSRCVA